MSKSFRNSMILSSVVLLLLGLTLIIWPTASQRIICFVAGALCVVIGLSRIIAQWKLSRDFGFQISYLFGILVLLVGLLLIIKADAMMSSSDQAPTVIQPPVTWVSAVARPDTPPGAMSFGIVNMASPSATSAVPTPMAAASSSHCFVRNLMGSAP